MPGLGADLRRHLPHAIADLEAGPRALQGIDVYGDRGLHHARHSKYYNSLARLAVIVRQLCNSLIAQDRRIGSDTHRIRIGYASYAS